MPKDSNEAWSEKQISASTSGRLNEYFNTIFYKKKRLLLGFVFVRDSNFYII